MLQQWKRRRHLRVEPLGPTDAPKASNAQQVVMVHVTPERVDWCEEWIPWSNRITDKEKIAFYVRLLWKFQKAVEARMAKVPNEKGVRAFSLFPYSSSYSTAHIKINGTTLAGVCQRIKEESGVSMVERWNLPDIQQNKNVFSKVRWTVMRKAFSVDMFETLRSDTTISKQEFFMMSVEEKYAHASHLFANQVTTDGYGASILLFRPKNELDEAETRSKRLVPEGYRPDIVIGLDPGMRSLCTAVREDLRPKRVRRRSVRKKGRRKRSWIRRYGGPRHKNGRDIIEVHSKEYRHLAGFRKRRAWEEGLKNSNPKYATVIREMPSFKTSKYKDYLERLEYFWTHARFLLDFCWQKPFLK